MSNPRTRALTKAVLCLVGIWTLAIAGYYLSDHLKMTGEKVRAYVEGVDLDALSPTDRAAALKRLAEMLNKLSMEERQQMRLGRTAEKWFRQMTEEEKAAFIEATMPTGFKQMIAAFEEQPEEKRRRAVDEALKRLRETSAKMPGDARSSSESGTNRPPPLSPELEAKVRTIGLKSFYSQSSAQTKAELAPVLEELQKLMESGRMSGRGPR
jgi:hypothetical protein